MRLGNDVMVYYHACSKCDARVRPSRIRNVVEFMMSPLLIPYRCSICDHREFKYRFLNMKPVPGEEAEEDVDVLVDRNAVRVEKAASKKRPNRQ